MSNEPSLADILAGQTFKEVEGSGSTIKFEVGDEMIGTLKGVVEKQSDLNPERMQKAYTFTLAAPGTFSQGPQNDSKRVDVAAGTTVTLYGKGNLPYLMGSVAEGQLVKIVREADQKMEGRPRGKDITSSWKVYVAS